MDKKFNLSKNIKFAIISFVINIALVFISYKLVIHYVGIETLGLWSLLMAWAALIRVGDVGMGSSTLHFVSKNERDHNLAKVHQIIDTGFIMNFSAFLLLTIIGYLVISLNIDTIVKDVHFQTLAIQILPVMFISVFLSTLHGVIFGSIQGLHFGYITSYITVIGNMIQIFLVLILVPKIGVLGLIEAQLVQYVFMIITGWYFLIKKSEKRNILPLDFSFSTLKEMLNFSVKVQAANITNSLFEPLSKILFGQYGNLQMQGLYELAYKTVSLSRNSVVSGLTASLPSITNMIHNDKTKIKDFYKKSQKNVLKGITLIASAVIIAAPLISLIWIGKFEIHYWLFVSIIYLGFWLNTFGATAYNLGLASGKMSNNIFSTVSAVLTLVVFGNLLGYFYDSQGVVIAVSISLAFGGLLIKHLNEKTILGKIENV